MTRIKHTLSLRKTILAVLATLMLGIIAIPAAHATLMVMPIWIIFQDRERTANVTLINTSNQESVFRIGWRYQRQVENGSYAIEETAINPDYDVADMVLYSPRQVVLPPRGKQRVRLSLRRPADLPDGEYRAHLLLTRLGTEASAEARGKQLPQDKLAIAMNINVGYPLHFIIRQGSNDATATISDPQFLPAPKPGAKPILQVKVTRTGKFGTMGNVRVFWTPNGGSEQPIGELNNVNVFPELDTRLVPVSLTVDSIPSGTIRVIYEGDGPDKGRVFDEKTIPVGG